MIIDVVTHEEWLSDILSSLDFARACDDRQAVLHYQTLLSHVVRPKPLRAGEGDAG